MQYNSTFVQHIGIYVKQSITSKVVARADNLKNCDPRGWLLAVSL